MFEESVSFIPSVWASMNSWFTPTVLFVFLNLTIGTIAITSSLSTQKGNNDNDQQEHHSRHQHHHHQQLARSPSIFHGLKSINFYSFRSPEPNTSFAETPPGYEQEQEQPQDQDQSPQLGSRSPSILEKLKSINLYYYLDKTQEAADTHYSPNQEQQEEEQEGHLEPEQDEEEINFQDQEQSRDDEMYNQLKKGSILARTKSGGDTKPALGEIILKKLPKKMKKSAGSKSAFHHFKEEDLFEVEARRPGTVKEFGNPKVTRFDDDEGVDAKADDFINKFKQQLKLQSKN